MPRVTIQRYADDVKSGWIVDVDDPDIYDTSSRFFTVEADARTFAQHLADLLILGVPEDIEADEG